MADADPNAPDIQYKKWVEEQTVKCMRHKQMQCWSARIVPVPEWQMRVITMMQQSDNGSVPPKPSRMESVRDLISNCYPGRPVTTASVRVVDHSEYEMHSPRACGHCDESNYPTFLTAPGVVIQCLVITFAASNRCRVVIEKMYCADHDAQAMRFPTVHINENEAWKRVVHINKGGVWEVNGSILRAVGNDKALMVAGPPDSSMKDGYLDIEDAEILGWDSLAGHGLVYNLSPHFLVCVRCRNGPFVLLTRDRADKARMLPVVLRHFGALDVINHVLPFFAQ